MHRIADILRDIDIIPNTRMHIDKFEDGELWVLLPTGRKQRIRIKKEGNRYILSSTALGAAQVDKHLDTWPKTAELIWQRNAACDVVTFYEDIYGRIQGRIEQLVSTADKEEILFYVSLLAQECDRFEYLVSGQDRL